MRILLLVLLSTSVFGQTWTDLGSASKVSNGFSANTGAGSCGTAGACSSLDYAFHDLGPSLVVPWSGGFMDTVNNRQCIWGGGHSDYFGNEVLCLPFSSNTMTRMYAPSAFNYTGSGTSPCAAFAKTSSTLCDGAPAARHTYDGLVAVPRYNAVWSFMGNTPGGTVDKTTFKLDLSGTMTAAKWSQKTTYPGGAWNNFACDDDPIRDRAWCIGGAGTLQVLAYYDYQADTWTTTSSSINNLGMSGLIANDKMIVLGNSTRGSTTQAAFYVNLDGVDGYTAHDLTSILNPTCGPLITSAYPGLALDPRDGKIVGKPIDTTNVYILDPLTWACTVESASGGPSVANSLVTGVFGRWQFVPSLGGFAYIADWTQDVFVFYRGGGGVEMGGNLTVSGHLTH